MFEKNEDLLKQLEDIYPMAIDSFGDMTEEEIEAYFKEANADPDKFLENLVEE